MLAPWKPKLIKAPPGRAGEKAAPLPPPKQLATGFVANWPVKEAAVEWLKTQGILTPGQERRWGAEATAQAGAATSLVTGSVRDRIKRAMIDSLTESDPDQAWYSRIKSIVSVSAYEAEAMQRTYSHRAFHRGLEAGTENPIIGDLLPYYKWLGTDDARQRPTHRAMNNKVAHKNSPLAAKMKSLIDDYSCRCTLVPISRAEAVAAGIDDDSGWIEPAAEDQPREESIDREPVDSSTLEPEPAARSSTARTVSIQLPGGGSAYLDADLVWQASDPEIAAELNRRFKVDNPAIAKSIAEQAAMVLRGLVNIS